jgi:hypothetical protein
MAIGNGIGSSVGFAAESTFGSFATPSRWLEFMDENLDFNKVIAQGKGLRATGIMDASNRRVIAGSSAAGDINLEIPTKGLGLLLSMFFGASTLTQQGASAAWLQVHTLADLLGKSLTIQKGVPTTAGTVVPYTFLGCKGSKMELHSSIGQLVTGKFSFDAYDMITSQAYAAPSYPTTSLPLSFAGGSLMVGGSPVFSTTALATGGTPIAAVTDFGFTLDRALDASRFYFGGSGKKAEQIPGLALGKINLKADFVDTTFPVAFAADTPLSLVLTFVGQTIASTYKETLQLVIPAIRFNNELPKVNGPKIISLSIDGDILDDRVNSPIYLGYQSSDTAL